MIHQLQEREEYGNDLAYTKCFCSGTYCIFFSIVFVKMVLNGGDMAENIAVIA
jgi:hypothetical protein